ncbi:MAG: hypothetical protein WCV83_03515 [Candidatus Magasanikbacteria bacterium]
MSKRICITFAGAIGSSKTPIANYLSVKLNLPVFNNDAVRTEVTEDLGKFDSVEHIKRRNKRLKEITKSGISFICDLSVDREWKMLKKLLVKNKYRWFIISLDLSKQFLIKLYKVKGYSNSLNVLDKFWNDHDNFIKNNGNEIGLHISDVDFKNRCETSFKKVRKYLNV